MSLDDTVEPLEAPIEYWDGFKVVLAKTFTVQTCIFSFEIIYRMQSDTSAIMAALSKDGKLTIYAGYPWDLNSAKIPDVKPSIKASCAHDVLCDMVNLGLLPGYLQPLIDKLYYDICVAKGMPEKMARMGLLGITSHMAEKGAKRFEREVHEA